MSQETVTFIVERLLDDRNFLIQFTLEPLGTLAGVRREGRELTAAEAVALVQADTQMWFWPDEKHGVTTLRDVLVALETSRQRPSSLNGAAGSTADAANQSCAALADFRITLDAESATPSVGGSNRVAPLGLALSAGEGPRYRVFDGGGSLAAAESSPARRRRGFGWLLLALLCFVVAFVLGFATGSAHAAQDTPLFKTEVVEERECVTLQVRPQMMVPLSSGDIRIEARIGRHPHHRQVVIRWDGGAAGAGSSVQSLNGDDEPYLFVRTMKNQPAATWEFVAEVYDERGKVVGRDIAAIQMPEAIKR